MRQLNNDRAKIVQLYPDLKVPITALSSLLYDLEILDQQLSASLTKSEEC